jgi:hypothetical protein
VRYIKEYMLMRREARQWLVMAAAERGLNVVSHGQVHSQLVQNAIDGFGGWDHLAGLPVPMYKDVRRLLAASGLTLAHANWSPIMYYYSPRLSVAERAKQQRLYTPDHYNGDRVFGHDSLNPGWVMNWKVHRNLAEFVADGGHLGAGAHGEPVGLGVQMQLWGYVQGGVRPLDALRAGTLRGAEALGMDRDLGSLEVGKLGDLIILERNPLENIRHTNTIESIVHNGRLRDAATLDELWPRKRAVPPAWWLSRN